MKSKPIIICAFQRSGTTALTNLLAKSANITNFGEIFASGNINKPQSFYYFLKINENLTKAYLIKPNFDNAKMVLKAYLSYLSSLSQTAFFLIDIKYDAWNSIATFSHLPTDEPFMLKFFKKQNIPIIHIVRKNTFKQYFSLQYGLIAKKWHYKKNEDTTTQKSINLEPNTTIQELEKIDSVTQLFTSFLKNSSIELLYEDMFDENKLTNTTITKLQQIIKDDPVLVTELPFIKTPVDPKEVISNKRQILDMAKNTKFEDMIREITK